MERLHLRKSVWAVVLALFVAAALTLAACGGTNTAMDGGSPSSAISPSASTGPAAPTALPTPAPAPTVAGTIAFQSDWSSTGDANISLVRTDGSGLRGVIETRRGETSPAWSPDGRRIAYEVEVDNQYVDVTLAVARADGGDAHTLPLGKDGGTYPAWSPDGKRLVYSSRWYPTDQHPPAHIFVCDADGSHRRQLTDGPDYDLHAQWTPDGQAILFLRVMGGWSAPGEVYSVRPDGSGLTQVTSTGSGSLGDTGTITEFALSPDGSQLAVADVAPYSIMLLPFGASGPPKTLLATDFDWGIVHISWSPDGEALVLGHSVEAGGPDDVFVIVNADGSGLSAIPGVVGREPEWRPE